MMDKFSGNSKFTAWLTEVALQPMQSGDFVETYQRGMAYATEGIVENLGGHSTLE